MSIISIYHFALLTLLLIFLHTPPSLSLSTRTAIHALLTLRATLKGRTLHWNTTTDPCNWYGIHCHSGNITALHLPGSSLSGQIPRGIFSSLPHLRTLSLRSNHLTSPLPSDLGSCSELRYLYLQHNSFTGPIPEFVGNLKKLVRLSLSDNGFSGGVPLFLGDMRNLTRVYLENNELVGVLPEYNTVGFEFFNVSNNRLTGSVPNRLSSFPVSSFLGNRGLCGRPLDVCSPNASDAGARNLNTVHWKKGLPGVAVAGIVIGSVLAFAIILMAIIFMYIKNKSKKNLSSIEGNPFEKGENGGPGNGYSVSAVATTNGSRNARESNGGSTSTKLVYFGNGVDGKMFDLEHLLRASAEVLGRGTFGTAYKAILETGTVVAVKRLKDVILSASEFKEKIEAVGALDHENLVSLRGYHYNGDEKLLVYDYMPMGSLSAFLHGNTGTGRTPLNWEMRSSIALGIANGIDYLHHKGFPHGNIKSSNILLTRSYEPRVSDFALAHLVGPSTPTRANGYRAPEVTDPQSVSQKADVYSFGVLIMELLTGKAPTLTLLNEEGTGLPQWVNSFPKYEWTTDVLDLELLRYQNQAEDEMVELLQIAVDCAAQFPDNRPTMAQVIQRIDELISHSEVDN